MPPDRFSRPTGTARPALSKALRVAVAAAVTGLAGCATAPASVAPAPASAALCEAPGTAAGHRAPASAVGTPESPAGSACTPPAVDPNAAWAMQFVLAYAERLHGLSPAELGSEIASLGDPGQQPMGQMQLALALTHTHQAVDTARALGLFQRVVAHTTPGAAPYKPLARLLAARLMDQRRLEEAVDKQNQQLREQQRRIDQLNERLEAMRAIERSLNSRPGAAPGGRGIRPPAAP